MKRPKSMPGRWILTIMLALFLATYYSVPNSRIYLLEQKDQPVQQEQKLIAQEEVGIPIHTQYVSSASVRVGAAYLWIIPFGILGVCFLILCITRYFAQLSFYGSCIVSYTKACYTEATGRYNNMKLNEARLHVTPDHCDAHMEQTSRSICRPCILNRTVEEEPAWNI